MIYFVAVFLTSILLGASSEKYNATIKKCTCEWYQIQEESGICVDHNVTYVHMWNSTSLTGKDVHLNEIANVLIKPLDCPVNSKKVVLQGIALLSTEGELLPSPEPSTHNYCLENFISADGSPRQHYEFCVTYDPFRLCCPPNETMDDLGECGEPHQPFPIKYDYVVEDIQCSYESPAHDLVALDDSLITLKGIFGYYSESRSNNSCLVAHLKDGVTHYFKKYCECDGFTCVESCCSLSESYNVETASCEPSLDLYDPINIEFPGNIKSIPGTLACNESFVLDFSAQNHTVVTDGSLMPEVGRAIPIHSFCLGLVTKDNVTVSTGVGCMLDKLEAACMWRFTVVQVFFAISSIFIIVVLGVYLAIKDLRERTGGVSLISELIAMLISQVNLIVIQTRQHTFSPGGCLAAGIIEIIFVLASFFWLNVMCFDLWGTFRVVRPFNQNRLNKKLCLKYSLYAWGVPLLIGIAALTMEILDLYPRPNFTIYDGCFFTPSAEDITAQWVYLYGFIVLLLLLNASFFIHVILKLLGIQKEQRKLLGRKSIRNAKKKAAATENFKLYGKLFIIMGLSWVVEAFSSFATESHECYIWILDIVNLLRGILIFYIFVCKKSIRKKIMRSWSPSESSNSDRSRKTSAISLSTWLPSRKVSVPPTIKAIKEVES